MLDRTRAAFVLIFLCRHDPKRLTDIFLMHANDVVAFPLSVIAFDDDGHFIFEPHDFRLGGRQAKVAREHEADMLVLRMPVEMSGRRLQNVRRRYASGRNAPTIILQKQAVFGWAPARLN